MTTKKVLALLLAGAMLLSFAACGAANPAKSVEKAFEAIAESDYDKARSYFADTLSVMEGDVLIEECTTKNNVDNYVLDLIAKETLAKEITITGESETSVTVSIVMSNKAMEIAGIPDETAQITFHFTEGKISKIAYDQRTDYKANYAKYQGAGGNFSAQIQSDGTFKVTNVLKDGAAQKAGLKNGDIITAINGMNCTDMNSTVQEQSIRCRGELGTEVTLTVLRTVKKEQQTLTITYVREALKQQ